MIWLQSSSMNRITESTFTFNLKCFDMAMLAILHLYKITINYPNSTSFIPCCGDFSPIYSTLPSPHHQKATFGYSSILFTKLCISLTVSTPLQRKAMLEGTARQMTSYSMFLQNGISNVLKDSHTKKKRKTKSHNIMEVNQMQSCQQP